MLVEVNVVRIDNNVGVKACTHVAVMLVPVLLLVVMVVVVVVVDVMTSSTNRESGTRR